MGTLACPACGGAAETPESAPYIPFCLHCGWNVDANLSLARWTLRRLGRVLLGLLLLTWVAEVASKARGGGGGVGILFLVFLFGLGYAFLAKHIRRLSAAPGPDEMAASAAGTIHKNKLRSSLAGDQRASEKVARWASLPKPRRVRLRMQILAPGISLLGVCSLLYILPALSLVLRPQPLSPEAFVMILVVLTALGYVVFNRYAHEQSNRRLVTDGEVGTARIVGRAPVSIRGLAIWSGTQHVVSYEYSYAGGRRIDTCWYHEPLEPSCTEIPVFYDAEGASVAGGGTPYQLVEPLNLEITRPAD